MLASIQAIEKLAYWCILIQLPIYIAQKDAVLSGGLGWEQSDKGIIFFWWAIFQNLLPIFTGPIADRFGRSKVLTISSFIITSCYFLLGFLREFNLFFLIIILLSIGLAGFKPALQGWLSDILDENKSDSTGWGIYYMLLNLTVMFASSISKIFKDISWETVFIGSGVIFSLNFILILILRNYEKKRTKLDLQEIQKQINIFKNLKDIVREAGQQIISTKIYIIILSIAGFFLLYMQFYETLPNFIYDWSDTSNLVRLFNLPDFMTMSTNRGSMISYEWLYVLNSALIVILVVPISRLFNKIKISYSLIIGIMAAIAGIGMAGFSMMGWFTISGIIIYTLGEIIINPKFSQILSASAPKNLKSTYMGFMNVSLALGFGIGSISGGYLYGLFGEKEKLAGKYLVQNFSNINFTQNSSMNTLIEVSGNDAATNTQLLWNYFQPWIFWIPYLIIGAVACFVLFKYSKKLNLKIN